MARLPQPGSDKGQWGVILNDYLSQVHKADGTLKDNSVTATTIASGSITEQQLDGDVRAKLGAIAAPEWSAIVNKPAVIAAGSDQAAAKAALGLAKADVGLDNVDNTSDAVKNAATATLTHKTISGADNTLTDIAVSSLAASGTTDGTTYLRGDGVWATPAMAGGNGGGSLSGFPLRRAGEVSVAVSQEVASIFATATAPAGTKTLVLAESWDRPGVLKRIWIASDNTADTNGFMEQGGTIRIYTDDATVPAVSMSLGDFFCMANRSDVFATPRVGRTSRDGSGSGSGGGSAAYRYLHMPFQKYLRVEVENLTSTNTVFYGEASYATIDSFADLGSQQLAYSIKGLRVVNQAPKEPVTLCDFDGSGQVESLYLSFAGPDLGDNGVLEGNVEIFIDGELMPSWVSSGMEDTFNGGWYNMPVGGYPAGRSGDSSETGANLAMYRFFLDDPIFFSSHIKIVAWAGQSHEVSVASSTVQFAGYAGIWFDSATSINYVAVDTSVPAVIDDQMNQAAGMIDSGDWNQVIGNTQGVATGSTFIVPYGNTGVDQDVRIARKNVSLPTDYWVETRLRITDAVNDEQQAHLIILGSSPDPWFGSAVHLQLYRHAIDNWSINVRDDFDTAFVVNVGSGRDLTNIWVRFAFKKVGTKVTAYYSLNQSPVAWIPLGTWTPTKTGTALGVGTWTAGAEFDYLTVHPLKTVIS